MKEEHGKVHGPVITFHRWYIVISRWRAGGGMERVEQGKMGEVNQVRGAVIIY